MLRAYTLEYPFKILEMANQNQRRKISIDHMCKREWRRQQVMVMIMVKAHKLTRQAILMVRFESS